MPNDDQTSTPSPLSELAAILARGFLRLASRNSTPETSPTCLEVPSELRLSVPTS